VLGSERDLNTIQTVYEIDQLWVTFEPDVHKQRRLNRWCDEQGVKLVVLPGQPAFRQLCARPDWALPDKDTVDRYYKPAHSLKHIGSQ